MGDSGASGSGADAVTPPPPAPRSITRDTVDPDRSENLLHAFFGAFIGVWAGSSYGKLTSLPPWWVLLFSTVTFVVLLLFFRAFTTPSDDGVSSIQKVVFYTFSFVGAFGLGLFPEWLVNWHAGSNDLSFFNAVMLASVFFYWAVSLDARGMRLGMRNLFVRR